ncbi:hypothetical protein HPK19_03345 [Arthrobacter citreus]|nr:hypothetical protein HPK19_03345 [Arthrobacter citreus]
MNFNHLLETMDYMNKVKMVFLDHNDNMGFYSLEESEDIYNSSSFYAVENWLIKQGYDRCEIRKYGDEL